MKRLLAIGIIFLFIGSISSSTGLNVREQSNTTSNDKTLYVGGSGPGNYTKIQDAIDNASDGDTVFVYDDSSPYYENLEVDKSITLKGENKETTVINGSDSEIVVNISVDGVILSGFMVQNFENNLSAESSLISIQSKYNVISENIISGNTSYGIYLYHSEYNTISGNIITSAGDRWFDGIVLFEEENNNISRNIIKNCMTAIFIIWYSSNNSICGNTIINNEWGIQTGFYSINDTISLNNISYNSAGIGLVNCFNCKVTKNNFIGNNWSAMFAYWLLGAIPYGFRYKSLRDIRSAIKWDGNYWNKPRSHPKPIIGWIGTYNIITWLNFDWHPAEEPYDI